MISRFIIPLCVLLLGLTAFSCEEERFDPVLRLGDAPALTSPGTGASFLITEATAGDDLATFTWSAADFGFPAGVTYAVEADLAGNNFAAPATLAAALTTTETVIANNTVNNFLVSREVAGGTAQDVELRVRAVVGREDDGNVLVSAPVTINVTPFEAERVFPALNVPGAHQGWDPPSAPQIFDVNENGRFEGFVFFPEANNEFKFTDGPSWDVNYGDDGADGTLDQGGANIMATASGMHRLNVDINAQTYTVEATQWGLIGSATPTGWDADTDLVYNADEGTLSLTVDLVVGEIKFRANDAWDINLGDTGADGSLEYGGDNIAVGEDGNYTVTLLLNQPEYGFSLVKN